LSTFHLTRGEFQTARELGEQLLSLGQQQQDSALCVEAYSVLGTTVFHLGEFAHARAYLEQGIALYDPHQHRFLAFRYGQDPGVFCLCYLVRMLWFLGHPEQARQRSQEAIALAQELSHPFSLALAYTFAALVHQLRREERETQEWAEKAIAVCLEHGFGFYSAMGAILRGGALVAQGEQTEGLEQIRHGLDAWRATGSELFRPHLLALLAETHGLRGKAEEGLAVLAEALDATQKSGTRFYTAELYRLKGELTLQQENQKSKVKEQKPVLSLVEGSKIPNTQHPTPSTQAEAEAYFLKAIEIARQQDAKSWELRATTSLARLWQSQGKRHEAHTMLSVIYLWFTEGFDTKDLQDARALIEELDH
ncbi:MAG: tetratricopeptide repeat protein, partial [Deltaproteobacteria bacterium]|nr:tetratricopeptide repeat protein [Deltaproteobacteria bacterium]